uniref:Uncharacterized protein n=1 Tax=Plectus sambesii TaxID=2011161 RepID=A0A914WMF3_9BILA
MRRLGYIKEGPQSFPGARRPTTAQLIHVSEAALGAGGGRVTLSLCVRRLPRALSRSAAASGGCSIVFFAPIVGIYYHHHYRRRRHISKTANNPPTSRHIRDILVPVFVAPCRRRQSVTSTRSLDCGDSLPAPTVTAATASSYVRRRPVLQPVDRRVMIKMVNVNVRWLQQSSPKAHSVPPSFKDSPYPRPLVEPLFHHQSPAKTTTALLSPEAHPASKRSRDRRSDERYKTMPITFEEISEVDEEAVAAVDEQQRSSAAKELGGRSPYSLNAQDDWFFVPPRPARLLGCYSPQNSRSTPRLNRSFDLGTMPKRKRSGGSLEYLGADLLSLPSIPEAVTPISPNPRHHRGVDDDDSCDVGEVEDDNTAEFVDVEQLHVVPHHQPRNIFCSSFNEEQELDFDRRLST